MAGARRELQAGDEQWVVMVLRHWSSLSVFGWPLGGEKENPGCIGFLPVFDSYEAALAWRTEHNHPNAGIIAIAAPQPIDGVLK